MNLVNTLATTLDDVQEPHIAERKIHWWHEELQRLRDGAPRHPATQACKSELLELDAAQAACLGIVGAASTQRFTPAESESANDKTLLQSYQSRLALMAHSLSADIQDLQPDSHPELVSMAFARYEQLTRLPALIHRGQPVFSEELYRRFNVQPTDLARNIAVSATAETPDNGSATARLQQIPVTTDSPERQTDNQGRQQLLSHVIEQALETFTTAINSKEISSRYRQDTLLPLWRLLVLRQRQIRLWHKKQPDLLRERTTLTPLHKFFHAWRHRR